MLKVTKLTDNVDIDKGTVMLLGGFDGLHAGHRALLSYAKFAGLPVGIMTIIGGKGDQSLFTLSERAKIFQENGADFIFELPFSEIKDLSPNNFLQLLKTECNPKLLVCGEDFRFGAGAQGNPEFLKDRGQVRVEVQNLLKIGGEKVSSGNIKKHILQGEVEKARALLEAPFFVEGEVVTGRQIGRTIQFPTANVAYPKDKIALKKGVYQTETTIDGKTYKGITNYGARPTFDNDEVWTETHLIGFDGNLYGKRLTINFIKFLREIKKFDNASALKAQLEEDVRRVTEDD